MALTLTAATADDHPAFARLFAELAVPEPTPSRERFAEVIAPGTVVAREGDHVAGYAWARTRGDALHVVHVVTDPAFRKRGVGIRLMKALAERARALGHQRWMLNVKPENEAARRLYERVGMTVAFESASVRLAWADVPRIAMDETLSANMRVAPLAPSDDARFETGLGLASGELAAARALRRVVVGAETDTAQLGILALDPPFPGASPVRVRTPATARVLLEAVRDQASPEHTHLFVFAEGHPALEDALVDAGGTIAMRVLQMQGPVPREAH